VAPRWLTQTLSRGGRAEMSLLDPRGHLAPASRATPTARELDSRGFLLLPLGVCYRSARFRGRGPNGASCPSFNLAREAAALSLGTRISAPDALIPSGGPSICLRCGRLSCCRGQTQPHCCTRGDLAALDFYFDPVAFFKLSAASRFEGSSRSAFLKKSVANSFRPQPRKS